MTDPQPNKPAGLESSIPVEPDLPVTVYYAMERWHPERIGALALYCSDGRWGEAFDEFCHRHLQIPRYDRWAVPGGPAWLVADAADATLFQAARAQINFLVKFHELEQIVLITHFGCAYYTQQREEPAEKCLNLQVHDVCRAAATLHHWHPHLRVEAYLAMRRENCLSFHWLEINRESPSS